MFGKSPIVKIRKKKLTHKFSNRRKQNKRNYAKSADVVDVEEIHG